MRLTLLYLLVASFIIVSHSAVVNQNVEPLHSLAKRYCRGSATKDSSGTKCDKSSKCCSGVCKNSMPWPTCTVSHH